MMRVAWLTDIHLDTLDDEQREEALAEWSRCEADAFLIGGDIGEAATLTQFLARIDDVLQRPIYFVLGNHDYYRGSIAHVRQQIAELCNERPRLHYLTHDAPHQLASGVALVGHDGWADARIGDYENSPVMLHDYELIDELKQLSKLERWTRLKQLGDEAAAHIERALTAALETASHVYLLTHVPPTRSSCWYNGEVSDDLWAPHFTCKAVGDCVLRIMREHHAQRLTVLCGHTHSSGETRPLPNLQILTGEAEYGRPVVQQIFSF